MYEQFTVPANLVFGDLKVDLLESGIEKDLNSLIVTKSRGPDSIPPVLLRKTSRTLVKSICQVYKNSLRLKTFPSSWKHGVVSPIFKDGNRNEVEGGKLQISVPAGMKHTVTGKEM